MDWHFTVFEVIDMRSFSNLWYWIALAVTWSTASHWILGVPFDIVTRARRHGGQSQEDLEDMVRINVNRLLFITGVAGLLLLGLVCFLLTMLAVLGFVYDLEFAQALFMLAFPMSLVGLLSLSTARLIRQDDEGGAKLHSRMNRHRIIVQGIGIVAIFVTALWGMFQNLSHSFPAG